MADRCPHCSFNPTSYSDYCGRHDPRNNGWTPVAYPPDASGWYITYNPEWPDERPCLRFLDGVWHWNDDESTPMTEGDKYPITHWMPSPPAPNSPPAKDSSHE